MSIKGFTLMELIVVVAIIAILASIAYPSYIQHTINTNRENAKSELMEIANQMNMYKGTNQSFAGATVNQLYGSTVMPRQGVALYDLEFSPSPTLATGWTLIAKPIDAKRQEGDGWICLNDLGHKLWVKGETSCNDLSPLSDWNK